MKIAVRYYSRSGNTKAVADAIAGAVGVKALSVNAPNAEITEETDILFIGGALYAYGLASELKDYLKKTDGSKIRRAVVFSTSAISKHAIDLMKKGLSEKGISVDDRFFYVKGKQASSKLAEAEAFASGICGR